MSSSSRVLSIAGWLDRIWATSVDPERGRPTMKIGSGAWTPHPSRALKKAGVKSAFDRSTQPVIRSAA